MEFIVLFEMQNILLQLTRRQMLQMINTVASDMLAYDVYCIQLEVAEATAEATENTFNTIWTRGNACQVLCKRALMFQIMITAFLSTFLIKYN